MSCLPSYSGTSLAAGFPIASRFGLVRTTAEGAVTAFVEKHPPEECDTNLINAGTYVLEPAVIARNPEGVRCNIGQEIFPALVPRWAPAVRSLQDPSQHRWHG